jgi:predicted aldo/keto reductase-like oxidoreductase
MTILMSNVAAALDKTKLTAADARLMEKHACETSSSYCAGCGEICESAVEGAVLISDVMRCLMYHRSYGNSQQAKDAFAKLPEETARRLLTLDFSEAERKCPQRMRIGKLMKEAAQVLV